MADVEPEDIKQEDQCGDNVVLDHSYCSISATSRHIDIKVELNNSATDIAFSNDLCDESVDTDDKKWITDGDVDKSHLSADLCSSVCKQECESSGTSKHLGSHEESLHCNNVMNGIIVIKPENPLISPCDYTTNGIQQNGQPSSVPGCAQLQPDRDEHCIELDSAKQSSPQPGINQTIAKMSFTKFNIIKNIDHLKNLKCLGTKRPFKCSHCDKKYAASGQFFLHLTKKHRKEPKHKCPICNQDYKYSTYLKYHFKMCTGPKKTKKKSRKYVNRKKPKKIKKKSRKCPTCGVLFKINRFYDNHLKLHKEQYKCSYCDKDCGNASHLAVHLRTHTGEKPYKCSECSKCFTSTWGLSAHTKTHTNERPFKCSMCDLAFKRSRALRVHHRVHTKEKPFQCSTCGKCYRSLAPLQVHQRSHSGERPYICTHCSKGFVSNSVLKKHTRIHTGEKPFVCSTCGDAFMQSYKLKIHQRRKHTGERPFVCETCGRAFPEKSDLHVHMRTYTGDRPHVCETCGSAFRTKQNLQLHMRSHTGERPYVCETCNKSFRVRESLRVHMRIHSGERPFVCATCGKGFRSKVVLNVHGKTHNQ